MIALITSLPPKLSRIDPHGNEIGARYQSDCVSSWRRMQWQVYSVNSRTELANCDVPKLSDVRYCTIDRDAEFIAGRPLIFLSDLLLQGRKTHAEHIVITNSDILLRSGPELSTQIAKLQPGEALLSKRLDIRDVDRLEGQEYYLGYDFFALHRNDLFSVEDQGMIFGLPWWDYFLPFSLLLQGVEIRTTNLPVAYHLVHSSYWTQQEIWPTMGQRFKDFVRGKSDALSLSSQEAIELVEIANTKPRRLTYLSRAKRKKEQINILHELSRRTVRFIDNCSNLSAMV